MRLFGAQRNRRSGTRIGVAFGAGRVALARVDAGGRDGLPRLAAVAEFSGADHAALADRIEEWTDDHAPGKAVAHAVLGPGEYQVFQIEAPPVPAAELRRAAGWRVRDLIDFPVDQAVVDTFVPPASAQRGHNNVNVVVAHRATVLERIEQIKGAGLRLETIDIPELAQNSISARLPEARGGHALLALDATEGLITVYRDGEQFLARTLDSGHQALAADDPETAEGLVLEVQRSFDYFESALSQPPLGALYIYPAGDVTAPLLQSAQDNLVNVDCRAVALGDVVTVAEEPESPNATTLHAVGAALRSEGALA